MTHDRRITRVALEGFRGHHIAADLSAVTVVIGPNQSGKTSTRDALALALTGTVPGAATDKDGATTEWLAECAPPSGSFAVETRDAGGVTTRLSVSAGARVRRDLMCSAAISKLNRENGQARDRRYGLHGLAAVSVDIDALRAMRPELQELEVMRLCGAVASEWNGRTILATVAEQLASHLPDEPTAALVVELYRHDIAAGWAADVARLCGQPAIADITDPREALIKLREHIDGTVSFCDSRVRELKHLAEANPMAGVPGPADLERATAAANEARQAHEAAEREHGKAAATLEAAERRAAAASKAAQAAADLHTKTPKATDVAALEARVTEARTTLDAAKDRLRKAQCRTDEPIDLEALRAVYGTAVKAAKGTFQAATEAGAAADACDNKLDTLRDNLARFEGGVCPLCEGPATEHADKIRAGIVEAETALSKAIARHAEANAAWASADAAQTAAAKAVRDAEKARDAEHAETTAASQAVDAAQRALDQATTALSAAQATAQTAADRAQAVDSAKREADVTEAARRTAATAEHEARTRAATLRAAALEATTEAQRIAANRDRAEEGVARTRKAAADREEARARGKAYRAARRALSAVERDVLHGIIGPIAEPVNELVRMAGGETELGLLTLRPEGKFCLGFDRGGSFAPLSQLSDGHLAMAMAMITAAVHMAADTPFRLFALDRAEALDAQARPVLLGMLAWLVEQGALDQALVFAVADPDDATDVARWTAEGVTTLDIRACHTQVEGSALPATETETDDEAAA